VLAAILMGLGMLVLRSLSDGPPDPWRSFWLGFAGAIAVLQAWHLLFRVSGWAMAGLVLLGGCGIIVSRPVTSRRPSHTSKRCWTMGIALLIAAVWLADRALGPPVGDAGLYHLSYVRWATEHPIVPGLANLHYRLGFNSPSLLWTAATDGLGFGTHVSVSLLVVASTLRGLIGLGRLSRPKPDVVDVYWAFLLAPLVAHAVTLHELRISTPDPDTAMALVTMAAGGELVENTVRPSRAAAFAAAALALLAVCLKLSAAPFAVLLVTVVWMSRHVSAAAVAATGAALLVPWVVRNVVQTGYALFPIGIGAFPVEWRLPLDRLTTTSAAIREHFMPPAAWALTGGGHWLRGWFLWQVTRCPELILLPALVALVAGLRFRPHRAAWLLVPSAASLLLWLGVPAPRFGYPFAWTAAATLCVIAVDGHRRAPLAAWKLRLAAVTLALTPVIHRVVAWGAVANWQRVAETLVLEPAEGVGFHPAPIAELDTFVTRSGLHVSVPREGDQVWAAPLPASPEPDADLSLRQAPRLDRGFVVRRSGTAAGR
jgi:hypothetical protein